MSSVAQKSTVVPNGCSSDQLFKDAEEVVQLSTDLARLEDQFERKFFEYYMNAPTPGISDKHREMHALNEIKENDGDLWTEIDTKRARLKGLSLKASIVSSASRIHQVETGTNSPVS